MHKHILPVKFGGFLMLKQVVQPVVTLPLKDLRMRATNVRTFQNFHANFIYILRTCCTWGDENHFSTFSSIPNYRGVHIRIKILISCFCFFLVSYKIKYLDSDIKKIIPVHIVWVYGDWRHASTHFSSQS